MPGAQRLQSLNTAATLAQEYLCSIPLRMLKGWSEIIQFLGRQTYRWA